MHDKLPNAYDLYMHHIIPSALCALCGKMDDQMYIFKEFTAFSTVRLKANWIDWGKFDIVSLIISLTNL